MIVTRALPMHQVTLKGVDATGKAEAAHSAGAMPKRTTAVIAAKFPKHAAAAAAAAAAPPPSSSSAPSYKTSGGNNHQHHHRPGHMAAAAGFRTVVAGRAPPTAAVEPARSPPQASKPAVRPAAAGHLVLPSSAVATPHKTSSGGGVTSTSPVIKQVSTGRPIMIEATAPPGKRPDSGRSTSPKASATAGAAPPGVNNNTAAVAAAAGVVPTPIPDAATRGSAYVPMPQPPPSGLLRALAAQSGNLNWIPPRSPRSSNAGLTGSAQPDRPLSPRSSAIAAATTLVAPAAAPAPHPHTGHLNMIPAAALASVLSQGSPLPKSPVPKPQSDNPMHYTPTSPIHMDRPPAAAPSSPNAAARLPHAFPVAAATVTPQRSNMAPSDSLAVLNSSTPSAANFTPPQYWEERPISPIAANPISAVVVADRYAQLSPSEGMSLTWMSNSSLNSSLRSSLGSPVAPWRKPAWVDTHPAFDARAWSQSSLELETNLDDPAVVSTDHGPRAVPISPSGRLHLLSMEEDRAAGLPVRRLAGGRRVKSTEPSALGKPPAAPSENKPARPKSGQGNAAKPRADRPQSAAAVKKKPTGAPTSARGAGEGPSSRPSSARSAIVSNNAATRPVQPVATASREQLVSDE